MNEMKIGFEMEKIRLPLAVILPVRQIKNAQKNIRRYQTIRDSIKEGGMIEPLVVYPQKDKSGTYLIMDGHLRHAALKELGETDADCIIAKDDESYTYNSRVSRLAPIQEHKMILKAVRNGVKPERIAAALRIPLKNVQASMKLLDGIHDEAANLLKDKTISPKAIRLLKQVSYLRQIEIAELLVSTNSFATGYVEAMVIGTKKEELANPNKPKTKEGLTAEQIGKLEQEMESLEREFKDVEESYGENMLNLTCARGYIKKLLDNAKVVRFLNTNYSDIFSEFETIAAAEML